jgi:hypothetical protein
MTPDDHYTRRTLLAGIGAFGAVSTGDWLHRDADPAYTHYTYAQTTEDTDDARLRVAWQETYNGAFKQHQNGTAAANATDALDPQKAPRYVEESSGPVIELADVLPGDRGRLAIGIRAGEVPDDEEWIDVWMRLTLTTNHENGVTDPESVSPVEDDPPGPSSGDDDSTRPLGTGELAEALSVTAWIDAGTTGIGRCDGTLGVGESPIVDDSLVAADATLSGGRRVAECLDQGDHRCVGLTWGLMSGAGNAVQSDAVTFSIEFFGQPCGGSNPWS